MAEKPLHKGHTPGAPVCDVCVKPAPLPLSACCSPTFEGCGRCFNDCCSLKLCVHTCLLLCQVCGVAASLAVVTLLPLNLAPQGVEFNVVAREWRMKWSADADKQSLADAQAALVSVLASVRRASCVLHAIVWPTLLQVKAVPGVQSVQRVVCGGCLDFKVSFPAAGALRHRLCLLLLSPLALYAPHHPLRDAAGFRSSLRCRPTRSATGKRAASRPRHSSSSTSRPSPASLKLRPKHTRS